MEINKETPWNPIKQDTKKGKLRNYPYPSLINYGAFPQTWEDPAHRERGLDLQGDNDPLDVLELGTAKLRKTGDVYAVKVLGALAMVDGGEMDWKIVTVAVDDPLAAQVDDLRQTLSNDMEERLTKIREWFRDYKIPDGKPPNEFAFDGRYLSKDVAVEVVESQTRLWRNLVSRERTENDELWWTKKTFQ